MTTEVFCTVEGTIDDSTYCDDGSEHETAEAMAEELAIAAQYQGFAEWQVFILPHYCFGDDECNCSSYLTDHKPVYSSETWQS